MILDMIKKSINKIGIKEIARRSGLSASTVSRVNSGAINPSFDVLDKIVAATGFTLSLHPVQPILIPPRLTAAKDILIRLRKELKQLGVSHVVIFGSVARGSDKSNSDIDIYLEFNKKPSATNLLRSEGRIIEAFPNTKVDLISKLDTTKGQKLKTEINKDGVIVF